MDAPDKPGLGARGAGRHTCGAYLRAGQGGFTFIEMVVVVMLLSVITAIIVPLYGNSISAMKARSARGDFISVLFFAQELAVRESREVRLYMDDRAGAYWLEGWRSGFGDDKVFEVLADGQQGAPHHFPDALSFSRVRARNDKKRNLSYISCFPNGACDRASIRISEQERGERDTTISTTGSLGGVEVRP